jgi:gamma-glutamyl:cysteine ligase YbdK (ATP-grasp superfamily)
MIKEPHVPLPLVTAYYPQLSEAKPQDAASQIHHRLAALPEEVEYLCCLLLPFNTWSDRRVVAHRSC